MFTKNYNYRFYVMPWSLNHFSHFEVLWSLFRTVLFYNFILIFISKKFFYSLKAYTYTVEIELVDYVNLFKICFAYITRLLPLTLSLP